MKKKYTHKAPITYAADESLTILLFSLLGISFESSARQTIHMECQALPSLKIIKRYFKIQSAVVAIGPLWVNMQKGLNMIAIIYHSYVIVQPLSKTGDLTFCRYIPSVRQKLRLQ